MPERTRRLRRGRIIYIVVMLALIAGLLIYFLPQYLERISTIE